jgi:hypothetical protein
MPIAEATEPTVEFAARDDLTHVMTIGYTLQSVNCRTHFRVAGRVECPIGNAAGTFSTISRFTLRQ